MKSFFITGKEVAKFQIYDPIHKLQCIFVFAMNVWIMETRVARVWDNLRSFSIGNALREITLGCIFTIAIRVERVDKLYYVRTDGFIFSSNRLNSHFSGNSVNFRDFVHTVSLSVWNLFKPTRFLFQICSRVLCARLRKWPFPQKDLGTENREFRNYQELRFFRTINFLHLYFDVLISFGFAIFHKCFFSGTTCSIEAILY